MFSLEEVTFLEKKKPTSVYIFKNIYCQYFLAPWNFLKRGSLKGFSGFWSKIIVLNFPVLGEQQTIGKTETKS